VVVDCGRGRLCGRGLGGLDLWVKDCFLLPESMIELSEALVKVGGILKLRRSNVMNEESPGGVMHVKLWV
jgi:hypothetical protein